MSAIDFGLFARTAVDPPSQGGGYEDNPPPHNEDVVATVAKCERFDSKSGQPFVRVNYKTVDGKYRWSSVHGFSETAVPVTKRVLAQLGVDVAAVNSTIALDQELGKVVGRAFQFRCQHKPDGKVNTWNNGPATLEAPPTPAAPSAPATADTPDTTDDLPF
jgi:hypothetical protein